MGTNGVECHTPEHFYKYKVEEYAAVEGETSKEQEQNMMAEIFHRGPISCGISVTKELLNYKEGVLIKEING